jgi:hypothetical protein
MQNNTPEVRACQWQSGDKTPEQMFSSPETIRRSNELLEQSKTPQKRKVVEAMLKDMATYEPKNIVREKISEGLTTSDLDAIITEVGGKPLITPVTKVIDACNQPNETPAKQKSIEESRKLLDTFNDKLKNYPKYLTYEGAVVLCVMVSVNEGESINLNGMPLEDKALILSLLPPTATAHLLRFDAKLTVEFDEAKDFVLTYKHKDEAPVVLRFFNAVIHPQKLPDTNVPVQQDGGKVMVGGAVVMDQKRIQKLIGVVPQEKKREEEDEYPRRQPVTGRNAYEIRSDILTLAVEFLNRDGGGKHTTDDVIQVAKKFYSFVENRR